MATHTSMVRGDGIIIQQWCTGSPMMIGAVSVGSSGKAITNYASRSQSLTDLSTLPTCFSELPCT